MNFKTFAPASLLAMVPMVAFSQHKAVEFASSVPESVDVSPAYEQARAILNGLAAEEDKLKARQLLQTAADQGSPKAKAALGVMLAEGAGGPKDDARALEYFSQAAEAGQREGLYNRGIFLLQGRGASRDLAAALASLTAAAAAGSIPAHVKLADLYYFGTEGLEKDHSRSLPHVKAAATAGDAWACNILGTMAELGQAMEVSRSSALYWFGLAADKGHAKAQGNLGRMLRSGKPSDREKVECYKWLKLSSLQGISMSTYQLGVHSLSMTAAQIADGEREALRFNAERSKTPGASFAQPTPDAK